MYKLVDTMIMDGENLVATIPDIPDARVKAQVMVSRANDYTEDEELLDLVGTAINDRDMRRIRSWLRSRDPRSIPTP